MAKNLEASKSVPHINIDRIISHQLYSPFCHSKVVNDKYSYHPSEIKILDELRKWSLQYFSTICIFDHETTIPVAKVLDKEGNAYYKNFDIHGKIIHCENIFENEE